MYHSKSHYGGDYLLPVINLHGSVLLVYFISVFIIPIIVAMLYNNLETHSKEEKTKLTTKISGIAFCSID